ncbi:hypothetical protein OsJ_23739 [Oryza sativa Japonica Group]|uniref:Uncharacterized protein n=1 Tax=Oryza sativa subsp. japonica TaxID=39947 RepID=A3BIB5_ORYSJ|nr:hypothetical protein OsJ_23739 [Oryza sativa Japonica Group]
MAELTEGTCEGAQGCRMYMRLRWSPNLRRCVRSMSRLSRESDQGRCRSWQASEKPRSCGIRILCAQLRWRLLGRGATLRHGFHRIATTKAIDRANHKARARISWAAWFVDMNLGSGLRLRRAAVQAMEELDAGRLQLVVAAEVVASGSRRTHLQMGALSSAGWGDQGGAAAWLLCS